MRSAGGHMRSAGGHQEVSRRSAGGQKVSRRVSPELEVLVAGLELQPVEGGDEDPAGDEADEGGGRQDHQDHRALYSTVQYSTVQYSTAQFSTVQHSTWV